MTLSENNHQKHTSLARRSYGEFGEQEFAFFGTTDETIRQLFRELLVHLSPGFSVAVAGADYPDFTPEHEQDSIPYASLAYREDNNGSTWRSFENLNVFHRRSLFNAADLVLINGNYYPGRNRVLLIDSENDREADVPFSDEVVMVIKMRENEDVSLLKGLLKKEVPVFFIRDTVGIAMFIREWMKKKRPPVNGLILNGGRSLRMGEDKGSIAYHGKSQRLYLAEIMAPHCQQLYISCSDDSSRAERENITALADTFVNLGPYGGILSAFRHQPASAWLVVACDLPYLSSSTLGYLLQHRRPSKVATAFRDAEGRYPEPMVAVWEPRAYLVLLEFLSQGYSCPRKVMINSDVQLLTAPDSLELKNVNHPKEREEAMRFFNKRS